MPVLRSRSSELMGAVQWPLVGREADLATITAALTRGSRRSVVITGPAGVGRTRLAREALALADQQGCPTRWAVATRAASLVPLGALAHMLPAVDVGSTGLALLQQATSAVAGDGAGLVPVLGVDDVHLLDQMSVTLLHQLATSGAATLVLTVRSGAAGPDPAAPLWKDGLADRIELAPLRRGETVRLLGQALDGNVDTRTAQRLWRLSGGNPLFLRELLEDGIRTGRLGSSEGIWRWEGVMRPSERLCEIVLAQIGELDPGEWRVLEAFATAEPLPAQEVETLSSPELVAQLERRGIVTDDVEGQPGSVRLAHPLYTAVVRSRAPKAALRLIRRQLPADSWDDRSSDGMAARGLALLEGGGPAPDARQLTEAAWRAAVMLDHHTAERLARVALDAGGGLPARLALVEAAGWLRDPAQVERLAAEAEEAATTDDGHGELAVTRALALACAQGRVAEGRALLSGHAGAVRSEESRALLAAAGAVLAFSEGDPGRAVDEGRAVLSSCAAGGPARALALAATALGLAVTGSPTAALATAEDGWATLGSLDRGTALAFVRVALAHAEVLALRLDGRIRDLEARVRQLHEQNLAAPEWCGDAATSLHCGWAAFAAGRMRVAVRWLVEAQAGLRRADPAGLLPLCRSLLAIAKALLADVPGARELVRELDDPAVPAAPVYAPHALLARSLVAGADGRTSEAGLAAGQAAERAAEQGQTAVEAVILHTTFRFGRPAGTVHRLRELAGCLGSPFVVDLAGHVAAVAEQSGEDLELLSRRFEEGGLLLTAADAAGEAAAVHELKGLRRAAAAAKTRAVTLARECGLSGSPSLEMLSPPSLTTREEEVARLASWGMSNVAIADRLVVSVRTVEAHLSHIYGKLGIASRAELADVLVGVRPALPANGAAQGLVTAAALRHPGAPVRH